MARSPVKSASSPETKTPPRKLPIPPVVWPLLITLLCLGWFIGRPVFIDDTLFIRAAQQIQKHPADFYGFNINWFRSEELMATITENPPLASYYLALAASVLGWSERALHIAFLVPALAAVWGTFALARIHCRNPLLATLATLLTPVFLLAATTLMCDVMLLAFWVWTLVLFECGLERKRRLWFLGAGILAGLAYLTKFIGLALVPLLIVYGLLRQRRVGWWLIAAALPLIFVCSYEWLTYHLYGHGHFLQASLFALHEGERLALGKKLIVGTGFAGGCFLPFLFYIPFLWRGRIVLGWAALIAIAWVFPPHYWLPHEPGSTDGLVSFQSALLVCSGLQVLALAFTELWQRRQPGSWLLFCWVLGIFIFAIGINWTINGRSFLPAVPAIGILAARRFEQLRPAWAAARRWSLLIPAVPAAVLCLTLLRADFNAACGERDAARKVCEGYQAPGRTIWFEGHWGFQYYMEQRGAKALDLVHPKAKRGDMVAIPNTGYGVARPNPSVATLIDEIRLRPNTWCSTMSPSSRACFYASSRGEFPFIFCRLRPDRYFIFQHQAD